MFAEHFYRAYKHFVDASDSFACTKCAENPQDYHIITQISRVRYEGNLSTKYLIIILLMIGPHSLLAI